jgi:chemotaxis protein methyltransferase CheR
VARTARYDAATVRGLSAERRRRFFTIEGSDSILRPELRAMITFRQHDLLTAPASARTFDLVVCRNVVIYFTAAAKATVHQRLADSLRPGGILFVGTTETILSPGQFGLAADGPGLYSRIG